MGLLCRNAAWRLKDAFFVDQLWTKLWTNFGPVAGDLRCDLQDLHCDLQDLRCDLQDLHCDLQRK